MTLPLVEAKRARGMNHFAVEEQFNCSVGCESANQCEYYNNLPTNQAIPPPSSYVDTGNNFYYANYDDGVVPTNFQPSNHQQMQNYQNYPDQNTGQQVGGFYYPVEPTAGYSGANYFTDTAQTYPPCQGPKPWNFAECYGYYGEAPCQFANVVDMEDFM